MKSSRLLWGVIILLFGCLAACEKEKPQSPVPDSLSSLQELFRPAYQINADTIHQMIRIGLNENPVTPWDSALLAHYQEKDEFFWLNDSLISDKPAVQVADSMLFWLGNIPQHGVNPDLYSVDSIREELQQIRTLLKFGFLPSERRWNDSIDRISLKQCDVKLAMTALDSLRANPNAAFRRAQPSSPLYHKMQEELLRVNGWGVTDTTDYYRDRLLVNMERARWQYALDKGRKYQTVYLSADNNLRYCEDIYKYDPSLLEAMNNQNLKP